MSMDRLEKTVQKMSIKAENGMNYDKELVDVLNCFLEGQPAPTEPTNPIPVVEQLLGRKVSPFPLQAICDATEAFERLIGPDITEEYVDKWIDVSVYFHDVIEQLPPQTFEPDEDAMVDQMTEYLLAKGEDRQKMFMKAMEVFVEGSKRAIRECNWGCFAVLEGALLSYIIVLSSIEEEKKRQVETVKNFV